MPKLTAKRQVTIPKAICDALDLKPGDYIEIFERDGMAHLVKMTDKSLAGVFTGFVKNKPIPTSVEIKRAIKNRAAKKFMENNHGPLLGG